MLTITEMDDKTIVDKIIDKSIEVFEELECDIIAANTFRKCAALTKVMCTKVVEVHSYAFAECGELLRADFENAKQISDNAFTDCSKLDTLILRGDTVCTLTNANALAGTPIANGNGYVYVKQKLVNDYKADGIWKNYANSIKALEENADVCSRYGRQFVMKAPQTLGYTTQYLFADDRMVYAGDGNVLFWLKSGELYRPDIIQTKGEMKNDVIYLGKGIFQASYRPNNYGSYTIYHSSDHGYTWTQTTEPHPFSVSCTLGNTIIASGTDGTFCSTDGDIWTKVHDAKFRQILSNGEEIVALTTTEAYVTRNVTDWAMVASLTSTNAEIRYDGRWKLIDGKNLWSAESGQEWIHCGTMSYAPGASKVAWVGDVVLSDVDGYYDYLCFSKDNGATWTTSDIRLTGAGNSQKVYCGGTFFVTTSKGVQYSRDLENWTICVPTQYMTLQLVGNKLLKISSNSKIVLALVDENTIEMNESSLKGTWYGDNEVAFCGYYMTAF